jgi:adenosine deaminase
MASGSLAASIPKIHLHCHLEGSLRASTFVELAAKHGVPLRYVPSNGTTRQDTLAPSEPFDSAQDKLRERTPKRGAAESKQDPYRFGSFQEFLYIFAAVSRSLRDPEDFARLAREFVEDALAQGVIYGELFVSPPVWKFFNPAVDVRATMEAIVSELRGARPRATFKLLPDLTRNFGADRALETARSIAAMTDLDVVGVSLGGDEARFPARLFVDAFAFARSEGLHCVAHAGEAGDAASVRDAIELLGVRRIGHGIRALEDARTVELLAARRIPLEICPTSNRLTGASLAGYAHPYLELDRRGCTVTIDCDDPAIFRTSIAGEYAWIERIAGAAVLERFVRNAIDASLADAQAKRAMQAQVASAAELHAAPRS